MLNGNSAVLPAVLGAGAKIRRNERPGSTPGPCGDQTETGMVGTVKRYKYSALVKLDTPGQAGLRPSLPEAGGRVVVRARHHDSQRTKIFSALVTTTMGEPLRAADHSIQLTMTVLGDDAADYLDAGDSFALWRGHDIGHGVISRRLSLWAESP